ncbi:MAG: hypothetical protein WD770_08425 [Actinomycetota bacterium]
MATNEVFEYAREAANDDVRATLDWLVANGFVLERTAGGPDAGFGDVVVELARGGAETVTIVRDRSQWTCDIQPDGMNTQPLDVLLAAMTGDQRALDPAPWPLEEPLPGQWPPGVAWRDAVPALLEWLSSGPRAADVNAAADQWRLARKKYWQDRLGEA